MPSSESLRLGNMFGTGVLGAIDYFEQRHGPAAMHALVAKLSPKWREVVRPNVPSMGVLGAKKYPYAFVGDMVRAMAVLARATDEDAFIREIASAGFDRTLDTVARVILRAIASPLDVAQRAPDLWRLFHDSGRLTIVEQGERHYLSQIAEWMGHDVAVCKLGVEAGRRIVERTGVRQVEARREKCVAWGHDVCVTRVRWTP